MFDNLWLKPFICAIISFGICFLGIKAFLLYANKSKKFYQPIRQSGPQTHLIEKKNTPTMGGLFIVISTLITSFLTLDVLNPYLFITLLVFILFSLIGLTDDLMKIFQKNTNGFRGSVKITIQFFIICATVLWLGYFNSQYLRGQIFIPVFDVQFITIGIALYAIFVTIVVVGTSNSVNLTDGLDGLVSIPVVINLICLIILTTIANLPYLSQELNIPYMAKTREIIAFCYILIGSISAFLMFNLKPAKIFMGDVGSLAIGAALGVIAVIIMEEFIFFVISLLFVFEALSVMLQVTSYKLRKKRIFLMAPLHHHFEKLGYGETQVVYLFWLASFIFATIGLTIYFI